MQLINFCSMPRGYGVVYADGACSGNGQPGASGGYGVYVPGIILLYKVVSFSLSVAKDLAGR